MSAEKPTVEWEDPPRTVRDEAADVMEAVREKPFTWARVGKSMSHSRAVSWRNALRDQDGYADFRLVRVDTEPIATLFEGLRRYDVYARATKGNAR